MKAYLSHLLPGRLISAYRNWESERRLPGAARIALAQDLRGLPVSDAGPEAAVVAGTKWLCRAQDQSRTADGGFARDFSLIDGWSSSYPETTGYIIPTLIAVAHRTGERELFSRCRRALDWLVAIQLSEGAFQGGRIDQTPVVPVTFNTGQILLGLAAGVAEFGDDHYRTAMHRAADFLRDTLDADGCWRRYPTPFARPGEKAYETHVSWGLFEAARISPDRGYGEAALKQLHWALSQQQPNGWFQNNCLENPSAPLTHTIGYVLRGVIEAYRFSAQKQFLESASRTAEALLSCMRDDGYIAGRLDKNWQPAVKYACLTGTVQIAACWLMLAGITGRREFAIAARKANCFVRRTVNYAGDPDTLGGVKGSYPVDGDYGQYQYLNWAAKFFIDANLLEMQTTDT